MKFSSLVLFVSLVAANSAFAQPAADQAGPPGLVGMAFPFILMFGVFYFLILRPQKKKMEEQQQMLTQLKNGDEIVTASGILGTVTGITEKVITVEVADKVRVKMLKNQVTQVLKPGQSIG